MPMPPIVREERCELPRYAMDVLAGESEQVSRMRLQIMRIAPHFRTVLVTGEAGTGKVAVARELYRLSAGADRKQPFVVRDIKSFAEDPVPIEPAGVLFLEGLDRLEPALQEGLVERLRAIQRQMKIVVSSECELRSLMSTGRLRQSLAARISGLEIRVVALRDRKEDLPALVKAMLLRLGSQAYFSTEALRVMALHDWPGNLTELWKVVSQLSMVEGAIRPELLPEFAPTQPLDDSGARLDKVMQRHVFDVLQRCSGNKLKAAEVLGISRSTLYRMLDAAAGECASL